MPRFDLHRSLPKVIDEQNFKPHATGLHRPTADVVNVSSAKPGNKNKASNSNLVTNYCKLQFQNGNPPIFAKACYLSSAPRFCFVLSLEIASPHYQLFLREPITWSRTMRSRPTLKFGHHHTPNRPESCHATWSPSGHLRESISRLSSKIWARDC